MKLPQNGTVSFPIRLAAFQARGGARMKLRQNGTVSFSIRLAAFQARGGARVKLPLFRQDLQDYQDFFLVGSATVPAIFPGTR